MNEDIQFVNLTPHTIDVEVDGIRHTFPSKGICRVAVKQSHYRTVSNIPLFLNLLGEVEGLPDPQPNTIYIVSLMVIEALRARSPDGIIRGDVVSPDSGPTAIRENGKIVAVRGFICEPYTIYV